MKNNTLFFFLLITIQLTFGQGQANGSPGGIESRIIDQNIATEKHSVHLVQRVSGLRQPWSVAFLPDDRYLITLKGGDLIIVDQEGRRTVSGLPQVSAVGQGGLLDVILHPDFSENQRIYFTYSSGRGNALGTTLGTAVLTSPSFEPRLSNVQVLWNTPDEYLSSGGQHFGSRVIFGSDGYVYFTIGDRGTMERSQNPADPAGTIIRLRPDGTIPDNNPFGESQVTNARGQTIRPLPEVFAYGTRNAQGIAMDAQGRIWFHEHGPRGGDEINLLVPGANYGWPAVTHGVNYSGTRISDRTTMPGVTDPVLHWTPSIAPSGFVFYQGAAFSGWNNSAFVGALAGQHVRRVEIQNNRVIEQEVMFSGTLGRIRDVRVNNQGYLYILTDGPNSTLYRLEPAD